MSNVSEMPKKDKAELSGKMFLFKGVCSVIGGILIMMFNGCFFLWANIAVYVLSYYYLYDKDIQIDAIFYVDFLLVLLNCIGYQIGTYLVNQRRWNPKLVLLLGGTISLSGIVTASYMKNFWAFLFCYGALSGIGCGINYFVPIVCSWEYFPNRKGLITGIMVGSYGLGSFVYTQISTRIINPNNE